MCLSFPTTYDKTSRIGINEYFLKNSLKGHVVNEIKWLFLFFHLYKCQVLSLNLNN